MARRIIWRGQARSDIAAIRAYIALDSPANAKKVVAAIEQAADGLVDFPYACRVIPESRILNDAKPSFTSIA